MDRIGLEREYKSLSPKKHFILAKKNLSLSGFRERRSDFSLKPVERRRQRGGGPARWFMVVLWFVTVVWIGYRDGYGGGLEELVEVLDESSMSSSDFCVFDL
jgi:hypothetical protein